MLKDGVYELFYRAASSPEGSYESMLMVLRGGNVLAADPWGGVASGRCELDPVSLTYRINVRMHVPPGGMLVTDDAPRNEGDEIEIVGEIDAAGEGTMAIDIGGRTVSIALKYQGPVPG